MKNEYIKALKILHKYLYCANIKWCIIGNTNLILQGINIKFSKIGILINYEDLNRFLTLFSDFQHTEIEDLENGEAQEFVLFIENVKCLVCAEYAHGLYRHLDASIINIMIEGIEIPCFSLKSEREAYQRLGMLEKSKLISEHMEKDIAKSIKNNF